MSSQKGYTAIEALFWTGGTLIIVFLLAMAFLGAMTTRDWLLGNGAERTSAVTPSSPTPSSSPPQPRAEYRTIAEAQIVFTECFGEACHGMLKAFEREYRDCPVVPIGPLTIDGQTVGYYFLVGGSQ